MSSEPEPRLLGPRFDAALLWAHELHPKTRKGSDVPYLSHLLAVAALVLEAGGTEDEAIGALLHDAIEDAKQTRETIAARFGETVAAIVIGCTDSIGGGENRGAEDWEPRKRRYIESIPHESSSVALVSCADKLHNARSILRDLRQRGEETWARFNAPEARQLWYYRALADAFTRRREDTRGLADDLDRAVRDLEGWRLDEGKARE